MSDTSHPKCPLCDEPLAIYAHETGCRAPRSDHCITTTLWRIAQMKSAIDAHAQTKERAEEERIGASISDGRADVARALVEVAYGGWEDHAPYTDLEREIIDDPYVGVESAMRVFLEQSLIKKREKKGRS